MKAEGDIYARDYPTNKVGTVMAVRLYYDKGGANYFSGTQDPRGYYLGVGPEEKRDGMRSFAMFSGAKRLVLPVDRKSPKAADKALDLVLKGPDVKRMMDAICTKKNLVVDMVTAADR